MCGIFGYVGTDTSATTRVTRGLRLLEYRGYDSWGIARVHGGRVALHKQVGPLTEAEPDLGPSRAALGHTRWATHGGVSQDNAHPFADCSGRLAIAHNGIIENRNELREQVEAGHHVFRSQTDSELVAHLIEDSLGTRAGEVDNLLQATLDVFRRLQGLNAVAVLDAQTGTLVAAKNGSPLVVGFAAGGHLLSSDPTTLGQGMETSVLEDGWAVRLGADEALFVEVEGAQVRNPARHRVPRDAPQAGRAGFPDFMSKEIHEQPNLLRHLADHARQDAQRLAAEITQATHVVLTGCGSAGHAGLAAQYLLSRAGYRACFVPGSELGNLQAHLDPRTLLVALSQSGETIDVVHAAKLAQARGSRVVALTNVRGSSLWRAADLGLGLRAGPERSVLSTKTLTSKLALLLLTSAALRGELQTELERLLAVASELSAMLQGPRRSAILSIATAIKDARSLFVLGRGLGHPLALESALKIKEVSYLHAEGFAGGELKHGVIAMIEANTPCIALTPNDETLPDVLSSAAQIKARGGQVIGVGPSPDGIFDHHIPVADLGEASLLCQSVPAQLLGYDLARLRGHNPDRPRNLAKSVTVK